MSHKKEPEKFNLNEIKDPNYVKGLSFKQLEDLSENISAEIIDKISINGGHLASNLGVVDATIALCRVFDFNQDKIIFDVGHQSYTYKILTGRSLERLRKSDGISGFQKLSESPYDHFECGHSSTSISAAKGMAIARDLNGDKYDVIAFIGDAALSNGLALEALNNISERNNKVIIVLNDNDMSITKPVGGLAKAFRNLSNSLLYRRSKNAYQRIMKKTGFGRWILSWTWGIKNWFKRHLMAINIFDNMNISYIGPIDGHNIKKMVKTFERAKKYEKPIVIHIKTIKGKGYKYSENDDSGKWHGVGMFDKHTGKVEIAPNTITWSEVYSKAVVEVMSENENTVTIVPATGVGSSLQNVFELFPNRCFDVGIAEEHALTMAGGLAVSGKHPIVSIYSTFLQRAFDELSHDIARMDLNATLLIDRSGLVGEDGNTHQGIYDAAYLLSTPNTVVTMASRGGEAASLLKESMNNHGLFCIRYPRSRIKIDNDEETVPFGTWKVELEGAKTAIVSTGPITLELKELLVSKNKNIALFNAIYLKPMDEKLINDRLLKFDRIIIYDAYGIENGFASQLATYLVSEKKYKGEIIIKAIPDVFVEHASIKEQLHKFGLAPEQITELL